MSAPILQRYDLPRRPLRGSSSNRNCHSEKTDQAARTSDTLDSPHPMLVHQQETQQFLVLSGLADLVARYSTGTALARRSVGMPESEHSLFEAHG